MRISGKLYHVICFCAALVPTWISTSPIITWYMRPYAGKKCVKKLKKKLSEPAGCAKYLLKHPIKRGGIGGIFVTYAGYLTTSQPDGQVQFPLHHSKPEVPLIITPKITPVLSKGNTVDHWEIPLETEAAIYQAERKKDSETNQLFWRVTAEKMPGDRIIPTHAVVIIAKPHNVHVPIDITLAKESANFILPDVYIHKGVNPLKNSLYMITMSHFFRPVRLRHDLKIPERDISHVEKAAT